MTMPKNIALLVVLINLTACSGLRTSDNAYSAHAENFNILFFQIPGHDTQKKAMELVPKGSEIKNISSSPTDVTSVVGFINRLLGIDSTSISGTVKKE